MKKIEATHSKGHYSAAVIHQNTVYVAGQLPINYAAGETAPAGGIEEQTRTALNNLAEVLTSSGSGMEKVLKTTVYIANIEYWSVVNRIYAEFFGQHKPARTIVPISDLHYGCLLEIDAIAAL